MTDKDFITLLNKEKINLSDLSMLVDQYCHDTDRTEEDFSKIMKFIEHIPMLGNSTVKNIVDFYKKKYNIMSVSSSENDIYFYTTIL